MKDNEMIIGGRTFITHSALSYGDYDNSCSVERANVRYLMQENEGTTEKIPMRLLTKWNIHEVELAEKTTLILALGDFTSVTAWLIDTPENRELINSLDDYALLDEDLMAEVEIEMLNDDWESWLKHDLLHQAIEYADERERVEIHFTDDDLFNAFHEACSEENTFYEVQAGGVGYVDIDRIAGAFKRILMNANKDIFNC